MQWLCNLSCDLGCLQLQETHFTDVTEASSWFSASDLSTVIAPGTIHSCCQVILYHWYFSPFSSWVELNGHHLIAAFCRRDITFRIACIYAPNRNLERNGFFISCLDFVDMWVPTILGGDFNGCLTELKIVEALGCLLLFATASFLWSFSFANAVLLIHRRHFYPNLHAFTWLKSDGFLYT